MGGGWNGERCVLSLGALHELHAEGADRSGALGRSDVVSSQTAPLGGAGTRARPGRGPVPRDARVAPVARRSEGDRAGEGTTDGALPAFGRRGVPSASPRRDG